MPEQETVDRAREDARERKSPSTQAGEFVREEMHHIREGKHGAANAKQAIAIGLSKARRAGVKLPASRRASSRTKAAALRTALSRQATKAAHARSAAARSRAGKKAAATRKRSSR
jgi:hypothetical protein